jgi:hypothetical protein
MEADPQLLLRTSLRDSQDSSSQFQITDWLNLSGAGGTVDGLNSPTSTDYTKKDLSTTFEGEVDGFGGESNTAVRGMGMESFLGPSEGGSTRSSSRSTLDYDKSQPPLIRRLTRSNTRSSSTRNQLAPRLSNQPSSDVPEAALNLLCLSLPSAGSVTGSFSSLFEFQGGGESEEEDNESIRSSEATSIHSNERKFFHPFHDWNSMATKNSTITTNCVLPPPGRSRASSFSSTSTTRARQHRPARAQRESRDSDIAVKRNQTASTSSYVESTGTSVEMDNNDQKSEAVDEEYMDRSPGKGKGKKALQRTRKRSHSATSSSIPVKRSKHSTTGPSSNIASTQRATRSTPVDQTLPSSPSINRTFPSTVEVDPAFGRFYRRFPVSTAFAPGSYVITYANTLPAAPSIVATTRSNPTARPQLNSNIVSQFQTLPPLANWAKSSDPLNLYHHHFVRGALSEKAAACPICIEPISRGGEGTEKFLKVRWS